MNVIESIRLTFVEGTSSKEYVVQILEEADGTYEVMAHYGRIGGALKPAPQGNGLTLDQARDVFGKTVNGKTRKGYQPDAGSANTSAVQAVREKNDTGLRPQLFNEVDETENERLLDDDAWAMQEKHNGERLMVRIKDGAVTPANRTGLQTVIPVPVTDALLALNLDAELDGELVKGEYFIFEILSLGDQNVEQQAFEDRDALLKTLPFAGPLKHVKTVYGSKAKRAYAQELRDRNAEGWLLKRKDGTRHAGRPASGGNQVKFKLWESCSAIVAAHNAKRSIALEMYDETGTLTSVGNVQVKANQTPPPVGAIVEVEYLYIVCKGGDLVQPHLLGVRTDILPEECVTSQLKIKDAKRNGAAA